MVIESELAPLDVSAYMFTHFPTETEELGSRELEIESKKFLIEIKANDQGKFVKILEVRECVKLPICSCSVYTLVIPRPCVFASCVCLVCLPHVCQPAGQQHVQRVPTHQTRLLP